MFKHILVPTDGSEFSMNTARRVVSFAKEAGARITAFNAKPEFQMPRYVEGVRVDTLAEEQFSMLAEEKAQHILDAVERMCSEAGVECTKLTKTNNVVYEAIIEAATECGCDLIFMAKHGHSGIGALLLGSETNKVLTHSKIPVLVYH